MIDSMRNLAVHDQIHTSWSSGKFSDAVVCGASSKSRLPMPGADHESSGDSLLLPVPRKDAVLIVLQILGFRSYRVWLDGSRTPIDLTFALGEPMAAFDSRGASRPGGPHQWLHFYVARNGSAAPNNHENLRSADPLPYPPSVRISDAIVNRLGEYLIEATRSAAVGSRRILECLVLALHMHLVQAYGEATTPVPAVRGGLAQWQVRRAKQIMSEHLEGTVAIQELAGACRLSASHFARAFKTTTGQSPHRWLLGYRVEHAQRLMTDSEHSLADIALSCGFADQSHFARVFSRLVGVAPGAWRRSFKNSSSS